MTNLIQGKQQREAEKIQEQEKKETYDKRIVLRLKQTRKKYKYNCRRKQ